MAASSFDPAKGLVATLGKDRILGYSTVTPQDQDFLDDTRSAFMPIPPSLIRNYFKDYQDVEPVNTPRFGGKVQFRFGNEGYALLYGLELIVKLPALGDSADGNLHPDDAAATVAQTGTFINWKPFIGEYFFGGEDDSLRQKHATETLRDYRPLQAHVKRRIFQNSEGTARRTAYEAAVDRSQSDTEGLAALNNEYIYHNVWCSWQDDLVNYHQMLPIHAAGLEKELEFRIPALSALVQTDGTIGNVVAKDGPAGSVGAQPEIFLRCHYVTPEAAERALHANMTLTTV